MDRGHRSFRSHGSAHNVFGRDMVRTARAYCDDTCVLQYSNHSADNNFLLCSALFIVFSRIIFKNTLLKKEAPHTNADAVIGEKAIITERVCNIENKGLAKVRGQIWSARSADGEDLEVGTIVSVISIQGVKLICRNIDSAENKN